MLWYVYQSKAFTFVGFRRNSRRRKTVGPGHHVEAVERDHGDQEGEDGGGRGHHEGACTRHTRVQGVRQQTCKRRERCSQFHQHVIISSFCANILSPKKYEA